ncbi:MAG: FAD-binding oxidoreductase [Candidatus Omnitrophica bacterium]|nr:FAD-binding oxidoreductase [Candidatus Omnitrophota bacterium]
MKRFHIAIIGSGVAGLSLAYFLAKKGAKRVLLLEQEKRLGLHASGKNAGMIRQVVTQEAIGRLALEGATFLRTRPPEWKVPYHSCGSLLLAKGKEKETLHRAASLAQKIGLGMRWLSVKQSIERVFVLKRADFEEALFCPTDGIIDIHALLRGYYEEAKEKGIEIWMGAKAQSIDADGEGGFKLSTSRGKVRAEILVNAAGAWAELIAQRAGASPISFRSYRRHLILSKPLKKVEPHWPFVWDMAHAVYFRPEKGGLLLSPCDQDPLPPGGCPADRSLAWGRLKERLVYFPMLPKISIRRIWGGLRTFSPDDNFCIGWDGSLKNFFWVAGLDGHGMTTSSAVGELASDLLLGRRIDRKMAEHFSPRRFQTGRVEEGD